MWLESVRHVPWGLAILTIPCVTEAADPVELSVTREGGNESSPFLYGIMFEVRKSHSFFFQNADFYLGNGSFRYPPL